MGVRTPWLATMLRAGDLPFTTQPNAVAIMRDAMRTRRQVMAMRGLLYSTRAAEYVDLIALVYDCGLFEPSDDDFGLWDEVGYSAVWSGFTLTEALGLMLALGVL